MKRIRHLISIGLLLMVIPLAGAFFAQSKPDIEDLVLLQLMTEADPEASIQALRAQAMLIRTNLTADPESIDVSRQAIGDILEQDTTGMKMKRFADAVNQTQGWIVKVDGKTVSLPYHQCSCGSTRAAEEVKGNKAPFLKSVSCPDDVLEKGFLQVREFKGGKKVKIVRRFKSGYVETVKVRGKMTVTMTGEAFRKKYGLPSSCFYLKKKKGKIYVITKGCGHGFGLSQSMADRLALKGKTDREIICYFFKKVEFIRNEG